MSAQSSAVTPPSAPAQRSWSDVLLLSLWVFAYRLLLTAFRIIRRVESGPNADKPLQ